jgi:hypothetical protein
MTLTQDFDEEEVEGLKVKILAALASLDRGLAANVSGHGHQPQQLSCQGGSSWVADQQLLHPQQGHPRVAHCGSCSRHACLHGVVSSRSTAAESQDQHTRQTLLPAVTCVLCFYHQHQPAA